MYHEKIGSLWTVYCYTNKRSQWFISHYLECKMWKIITIICMILALLFCFLTINVWYTWSHLDFSLNRVVAFHLFWCCVIFCTVLPFVWWIKVYIINFKNQCVQIITIVFAELTQFLIFVFLKPLIIVGLLITISC